ncbi:uncharacterized protein TRIADDRAFT_21977, partial [Trichoplax adhaerens]
ERCAKAEERIKTHPYDLEAWTILVREAQSKSIEIARVFYEKLLHQFPNAGRYWRIYVEHEMKNKNYERVEALFQRCLLKVMSIDLWKSYITYVRETKKHLPAFRDKMTQAYEFALGKMGLDIQSFQIWADYLEFLKTMEVSNAYAENQKIVAIRKVYQRAIVLPVINVEQLWKDYNTFEQTTNKNMAKKLIDERNKEFITAKRVSKEFEAITRGLVKGAPALPPHLTNLSQLQLWKRYIEWEKSNPLSTEDTLTLVKRVMFAYEQCLLVMGHHADVWNEAALFLESMSKVLSEKGDMQLGRELSQEAANVYQRAVDGLLKNNMLLYFAFADFEESRMQYEKCHSIYNKLLLRDDVDPTLVYIQYIKFVRRAEGIQSARKVFKKSRNDARSQYHVYVAAALMEYHCSKEKTISIKIFDLGLKKFGSNPDYVLCYIDFLSHLNDDNNTRVLFEKVLNQMPQEKTKQIWSAFLDFETNNGDLASLLKVEQRRNHINLEEYKGHQTALLVDRYKFRDLYPCSTSELRAMGYKIASLNNVIVQQKVNVENTSRQDDFPRPDFNQLIPFRPSSKPVLGVHVVPGGDFPVPPAVAYLMTQIPPPTCFVVFMSIMLYLNQVYSYNGGVLRMAVFNFSKLEYTAKMSITEGNEINHSRGSKRSAAYLENEDSDEEITARPPRHDVYRMRQQRRQG